ncbi:MAG TPA: alkaline phosphatase family protein, partial [Bacillota bacterium]|nr:alkaline phosphatase family protein [Bacillota bacterium]
MAERPKKVILTIIDSLNPVALESCFRQGLVPALQFLKERGQYYANCVSVFPTMTPTATSSIATGTMPDRHHVPGFVWFSRREKRFINYGTSFGAIWKIGIPNVIQDLLFNLNIKQLSR